MASKDALLCSGSDTESNLASSELSTDEASPKNNNIKNFILSTPKFDQPSPGSWSQPSSASSGRDSILQALLTGDLDNVKHMISPTKLEQLKRAWQEADKSYVELKVKELVAGAIPKAAGRCHEQLQKKVLSIAANSSLEGLKIKSKTGKVFTPLASSKEVLPKTDDTNLSEHEKVEFGWKLKESIKESLGDWKKESEKAKGKVGKNIAITKTDQSLVRNTEENKQETEINEIQNKIESIVTLITEKQTMSGELEELRIINNHKLAKSIRLSYENLQDKARLLNCKSSTLKIKCDMIKFENKSYTLEMDKLGDELKASIKKLKHETKEINEKLEEYKSKEQSSKSFRNTVKEYATCQANLEHLKSTLEMLQN